jgi:hypothetical protein
VVEVALWGLISPLPYVLDSIRFFDSTPLPYQRQRPGRTPEKMALLLAILDPIWNAARGSYLMGATGLQLSRARIRGRGRNVIRGRYASHIEGDRLRISLPYNEIPLLKVSTRACSTARHRTICIPGPRSSCTSGCRSRSSAGARRGVVQVMAGRR